MTGKAFPSSDCAVASFPPLPEASDYISFTASESISMAKPLPTRDLLFR